MSSIHEVSINSKVSYAIKICKDFENFDLQNLYTKKGNP